MKLIKQNITFSDVVMNMLTELTILRDLKYLLVEISLLNELVNCRYLRAMTVVAELSYVTLILVLRVISHLIQSLCAYFDSFLIFAVFISTEKILRCLQLRKSRKRG